MSELSRLLDAGDADGLRAALAADPDLCDRLVVEGDHAAHPIHAVCDRVFDGRVTEAQGYRLATILIKAGADLDHVHAANGDSLVTSAISLSAPDIAHALLDAGAPGDRRGLFGARPLHWASIMGMPDLVQRLLPGADLGERDAEFDSTPLGWAVEGWASPPKGSRGGQVRCAASLTAAGAVVEPQWRESKRIKTDPSMAAALGLS